MPLTDGRPPRVSSSRSSAPRISRARAMTLARQSGEPRDLDAVAAIRAARHDLAQEDDVVLPLARRDVEVDDAGRGVGEIGELVIVRGEQRLRPHLRVGREELGDRPGDAEAVEGRRAAADLVEHDQAARGRGVQDVGGLLHLDHERRVAARDVVRCADAREDAIDQRDLRLARRHERSGLRHDAEQRGLPQVGRLAAHVRAGEDHQLAGRARSA